MFALEGIEENPEARFALVRPGLAGKTDDATGSLELQVERGWRLRIPRGGDEATLRVVLGALSKSA